MTETFSFVSLALVCLIVSVFSVRRFITHGWRSRSLACTVAVLLAACGGGGDGGGSQTASGSSGSGGSTGTATGASAPGTSTVTPGGSGGTDTGTNTGANTGATSPGATTPAAPASGAASAVGAPAAVIAPAGSVFYGMNGHVNGVGGYVLSNPQQQLSQLKDLNVSMYRNDVSSQADAVKLANAAQMMLAHGVTVYPVLLQVVKNFTDEQTAYQSSYTLAQQIVGVQKYAYYEVTNELAPQCLVGWVDGVHSTDYDNQCFQIARGIIRGMIAGIKSVDPAGKIVIGGNTWMHYGFDQMLANGTQPDGTSGHPVVTWDITAWHWYSEQGDIRHACGGSGCYDVIGTLKSFGKPIWINEVGIRPDFPGTQDQAATFLYNDMLKALVSIAPQYDIQSLQVYELYDDPPTGQGPYGIMLNDGTTHKPDYAAVKNFIADNPM